jgi:hypothetical protein
MSKGQARSPSTFGICLQIKEVRRVDMIGLRLINMAARWRLRKL